MLPSICIRRAPLSFARGPSLLHASFNPTKCQTQKPSLRSVYELSWQSARRASTVSPKAKPTPKPGPVPAPQKPFRAPRLIVYHAGTPRIMFLGGLKISAFFVMGFFSFVTVPSFAESGAPLWQTLGVMAAGFIPLLAVWYLTSPMVMWIHFVVPRNFQKGPDAVELLMKNVPIDAEVTMTTMGILGKPRVSHMKLRDVRKERQRFGLINHVRTLDQDAIESRKWYQLPEMSQFKIEDKVVSNRKTKQLWMWYAIWHTFQQKQARMSRRQQGQSNERIG